MGWDVGKGEGFCLCSLKTLWPALLLVKETSDNLAPKPHFKKTRVLEVHIHSPELEAWLGLGDPSLALLAAALSRGKEVEARRKKSDWYAGERLDAEHAPIDCLGKLGLPTQGLWRDTD